MVDAFRYCYIGTSDFFWPAQYTPVRLTTNMQACWFFLLSGKLFQKLHCMYFHIFRRLMVHKEIHEVLLTTWRIFSLLQSHFRTIWKEFVSRVFLWQNMRSSFFTKYSITLIRALLKAMVEQRILNWKMYWFFSFFLTFQNTGEAHQ